ncbi:hypothetical protein LCGC14_1138440 [marine sediment metagenome]|uniref:Uncharacterized protein n=1 Tax=marine sediment metagenome TaxID=412755 RepID=A0A0F9M3T8_9ZZZZ
MSDRVSTLTPDQQRRRDIALVKDDLECWAYGYESGKPSGSLVFLRSIPGRMNLYMNWRVLLNPSQ